MKKKFFAGIAALVLAAALLPGVARAAEEPIVLPDPAVRVSVSANPVVAGGTAKVLVTIVNKSLTQISNVIVTATSTTASVTTPMLHVNPIAGGDSDSVEISVATPAHLAGENHSVRVTVDYTVGLEPESVQETVSVATYPPDAPLPLPTPTAAPAGPALSPNIIMTGPTSVTNLSPGASKTVSVTLKNAGTASASNISLYIEPNSKLGVSLGDTKTINSLGPNGTASFSLNVSASAGVESGTHPVTVKYIYFDSARKQYEGEAVFYVKTDNPKSSPAPAKASLTMDSFAVLGGNVTAGSPFTLSAALKNASSVNALNARVTISDFGGSGIFVVNSAASHNAGLVAAGKSEPVSFELNTDKNMKAGAYPLKFKLSYTDESGAEYSGDYTFYVYVNGKTTAGAVDAALIELVSLTGPAGEYKPGDVFRISLALKNSGEGASGGVKVSAAPVEAGAIVPRSSNIQQIMSMKPGETRTLSFDFSATAAAQTQNHSIGFTVEYDTGEKGPAGETLKESFSQFAGVNVLNPEDEEKPGETQKSTPKIIVSKYEVEPIIVQAGQEFDLTLVFKNTHSLKPVTNIKASLTVNETTEAKGNVFTPVNASDTFYIDRIEPREESTQRIRMYTVPDAMPKNYIITITFEYEDEDGNPFTSTEHVGVNVKQISKLDVGDVFLPSVVDAGFPIYVSFSIQNTGKVTLNNLKIKFEGEGFDTSGSDIIYGNFQAGNYDYYDGNITPTEPGQQTLKLVITYDDDMGEHIELVTEYPVSVNESMPYDPGFEGRPGFEDGWPDEIGQEAPAGLMGWVVSNAVWIIAGAAAVIAAGAVTAALIVRGRRRAKLDEQL